MCTATYGAPIYKFQTHGRIYVLTTSRLSRSFRPHNLSSQEGGGDSHKPLTFIMEQEKKLCFGVKLMCVEEFVKIKIFSSVPLTIRLKKTNSLHFYCCLSGLAAWWSGAVFSFELFLPPQAAA